MVYFDAIVLGKSCIALLIIGVGCCLLNFCEDYI